MTLVMSIAARMRDCAWPTKPTELMIALARLLMKANFANFDREVVQVSVNRNNLKNSHATYHHC